MLRSDDCCPVCRSSGLNEDFKDVLAELLSARARFLVVGAHAVAVHGIPRATGALDAWIDSDTQNVPRVWTALIRFGAPVEALGVTLPDLAKPEMIVQIGLPPRRIDVMTSVTGLAFEDAWASRATHRVDRLEVPFIGRAALIRNKRAGRPAEGSGRHRCSRTPGGKPRIMMDGPIRSSPGNRIARAPAVCRPNSPLVKNSHGDI